MPWPPARWPRPWRKGAAQQLHVLSVYDYAPVDTTDLPQSSPCVIGRISCGGRISSWSTNSEAYVAPCVRRGWRSAHLARGQSPEVIVEVASSLKAELLSLGSHSNQWY